MHPVLLRAELLRRGLSSDDLERLRRQGELTRVRRGAYARPVPEASVEERHRLLVAATLPQLGHEGVVSHVSAAALHGLPIWPDVAGRVHLTRPRPGGGQSRSLLQVHGSPLREADVVLMQGVPVTTLARTIADLGRTLSLDQAVAAGDRALQLGLTGADLGEVLDACRGWRGIGRAREVRALLDVRTESVGESVSRVRIHEALLPAPQPQYEVFDSRGHLVGRADFGWEEHRTLGEFDGRVKYGLGFDPGRSVEEVVWREKQREDALRDLGWQVVRWTWADLYVPGLLATRLRRAFARAAGWRNP
jgi:hypothetical protein